MAKYRLLRERLLAEAFWPPTICISLTRSPGTISAWFTKPRTSRRSRHGTIAADAQRRIGFPWSAMMVERSRRSVGATLAAARECSAQARGVRGFAVSANLAGGTHHAFARSRRGLLRVQRRRGRGARCCGARAPSRALRVIDCDVHQGNGTAAIFPRRSVGVHVVAARREELSVQQRDQRSRCRFEDGAGDEEYLAALTSHLPAGSRRARAGHRLLSRRRGPVRGRSARPAEADDRGLRDARSHRVRGVPRSAICRSPSR